MTATAAKATIATAAVNNFLMQNVSSSLCLPLPLLAGSVGRMPEGHRAFDERDHPVKCRAGDGCERNLGPNHVEAQPADLGRNAKAHADNGGSEEFCDDGP